jgi:hypothetical protein
MYCSNCGAKFEGNFCPMCGRARTSGAPNPTANQTAELLAVDVMEGIEFENYCISLLKKHGFTDLQTTQASGDQGVDIIGYKNGAKYAIQCKRYSSPLGNSPVQEVAAGKTYYDCQIAAVITNSTFTAGAKDLAEKTGVLLWDRSVISALIAFADGNPLASEPVSPPITTPIMDSLEISPAPAPEDEDTSAEFEQCFCDALSYLMRRSKVSKLLLQVEFNWRPEVAEKMMSLLSYSGFIASSTGIQKPLRDRDYLFLFRESFIEDNLPDGYYEGISRVPAYSKFHGFILTSLRVSLHIWDASCRIVRLISSVFKRMHNSKYRNAWYVLLCLAAISFFASIS